MKKLLVLPMLVFVTSAAHPAAAASFSDAVRDTFREDERAVAETLRELMDAAEKKELDHVDSLHLYGPKFSKFDESGFARQDAAASQAAERKGLAAVTSFRAKVEDLKVDVFGPVAIATFVMNYTVEAGEVKVSNKARSTMVFARDGDKWKVVHEHHSPLKPAP